MPDRTSCPGNRGGSLLGKAFSVPGQREAKLQEAKEESSMNLFFWFPAMFLLGLVLMGLFLLFLEACDRI